MDGLTATAQAEAYARFLKERAIPDYQSTQGNRGVYILRRSDGERTHFITLTFWDSCAAIERFAGADIDRAKYYPEDRDFLLEFEPTVTHYEVYASTEEV